MTDISVFAAFAAGLFSFLSPCVLPLVPSFLSVLGGCLTARSSGEKEKGGQAAEAPAPPARFHLIAAALFFITGFSCVFVVLGILFSGAGILLGGISRFINIAAGVVVIILGLNIIFNFLSILNYQKRASFVRRRRGFAGVFLAGAAFGAGWSPCVGPILGSILLLAGGNEPLRAALYLSAYSAGLGLPFLAAAVFFDGFRARRARLSAWIPRIKTASGVFLILMGIFILRGKLAALNAFFLKSGYALAAPAEGGEAAARFIPAAVFFLAALGPPVVRAVRKRGFPPRSMLAVCLVFLLLAISQAAGLLDCAGLISSWFLYQGL
ncbi:MAG: cytochrome c biogenesis protein CcdA [Spirochaetales bacterium]|jgi:cytochrome c-type biogenesis protein|nr:cytochrome c biogenesis protein CcdA [Spirochaetales bacterium]